MSDEDEDNSLRTCYIECDRNHGSNGTNVGGSCSAGAGSSLRHDLTIVVLTIVATCLALAAYNYYLQCQLQNSKNKSRTTTKDNNESTELLIGNNNSNTKDNEIVKKNNEILVQDNNGGSTELLIGNNRINNSFNSINSSKLLSLKSSKFLSLASKWSSTVLTLGPNLLGTDYFSSNTTSPNTIAASLAQIEGMQDKGNFLSGILSQMWNHVNVAVSNSIKDTLTPALKEMKLHFVKLDLGNVPIKTENIFIHRVDLDSSISGKKSNQAGIQIDMDVVWDGNCDIMLQATLTKSIKMTFGIQSLKLSGRMGILLSPLTTELPVISAVQYGFTNPPDIQLEFTGAAQKITSKFGFAQSGILSVIKSSLSDVMVLPQRMVMPVDLGSYDYLDTYQPPVGMIRVTAIEGKGFKILQKMLTKDIPDVYCKISLGASKPFRTSTQYDNLNPCWSEEACDFVLYDMDQKVYVEVFDEDKTPVDPDDPLGKAEIRVKDLFKNGGLVELELELEGEMTECFVTLSGELFHLSEQVRSLSSPKYEGKNQLCGLLTVIVTKASDLHIPKEDAATYVKVVYGEGSNHEQTFYTGVVTEYPGIDALNPMFDSAFHIPLNTTMMNQENPMSSPPSRRVSMSLTRNKPNNNAISFTLIDGDGGIGLDGHGELGKVTVTHESLLASNTQTITETRPIGDRGAKLEFRVIMNGMETEKEKMQEISQSKSFDNSIEGMGQESFYGGIEDENSATIRVTAMRGRGFHIRKRKIRKNDVPDVYCNIRIKSPGSTSRTDNNDQQLQASPFWQTKTIKDDTMPRWNESKDFSEVDCARDHVCVDVYDKNSKGTDKYLGSADFSVEKLLRKRLMEVELEFESELTKAYVTLVCIQLATTDDENTTSGTTKTVYGNVKNSIPATMRVIMMKKRKAMMPSILREYHLHLLILLLTIISLLTWELLHKIVDGTAPMMTRALTAITALAAPAAPAIPGGF